MSKNSLLEKALLQVENLEEAVKKNAKGILASSLKQELNDLLNEQSDEEEDVTDPEMEDEVADDESSELDTDTDTDTDVDDMDTDVDDTDVEGLDTDVEGENFDDDLNAEDEESEDVLDMTGASDSEVLKVFKAMKPEDGIVVKKDGNKLEVNTGTEEFIIQLDGAETDGLDMDTDVDDTDVEGLDSEVDDTEVDNMDTDVDDTDVEDTDVEDEPSDDLAEGEDNVYEIELDEEDDCEGELEECGKNLPEQDVDEAARTKWNVHGDKGGANRAGLKSKKVFKAGSGQMNEEVKRLKKQNEEYKKALTLFKEKLNEVAVFNANLAYATRLFTEQTTTKQEKLKILKRFDTVSTLTESKSLYTTIKSELENRKPITEAVTDKIFNNPTSSASKEVGILSESKAYENPQFKRMRELMGKVK